MTAPGNQNPSSSSSATLSVTEAHPKREKAEQPANHIEALRQLHAEFYGGPMAHADAFRMLPKIIERLEAHSKRMFKESPSQAWVEDHADEGPEVIGPSEAHPKEEVVTGTVAGCGNCHGEGCHLCSGKTEAAHPKEEKPFADWQDDPEKVRAHAEFTADVSAARKKDASSEPVNPSRQNARKLASKIVGAVLRELLARRAIVRELELAEDEVRAEVERTLTEKVEKVILSSQPNEEQSAPPVTQTPSMEGSNEQPERA